ncbi:MAG: cytochrome C [Candidatus Lustribacter sp.]|jgi:mono/diheme cytochrome c family protein
MKLWLLAFVVFAFGSSMLGARAATQPAPSAADIARGKYLVAFGACNSCHTPGWAENDGNIPVSQWLTGNTIGFRGPWGTVYPANLRMRFQQISESQWLFMIHTRGGHPPMQWTNLRVLTVADQRAIYRFVRSLGPAGVAEPSDLRPGVDPKAQFYDVTPQGLPTHSP